MSVIYSIGQGNFSITRENFTSFPLFQEESNTILINGKTYNKNSLQEEKVARSPYFSYSTMYNANNINTRTRTHSINYDGRTAFVGGRLPYRKDETIFQNSISFNDGTEIRVSESSGNTGCAIYQYKYGKILNTYRFSNGLGKTSLVKLDESSFIVVRNKINYGGFGINNTGRNDENSKISLFGKEYLELNKYASNQFLSPSLYSNNYYSAAALNQYSLASTSTAYNDVNLNDSILLFDKNLNLTKSYTLSGEEILNILGKTSNGSLIILTQGYIFNNETVTKEDGTTYTVAGPKTRLIVKMISPTLVETVLFSKNIHAGATTGYSTFARQIPYFDTKESCLYYLQMEYATGSSSSLCKLPIDIPNGKIGTVTNLSVTGLDLKTLYNYQDNCLNLFSIQIGSITVNNTKYLYIGNVFSHLNEIFYSDWDNYYYANASYSNAKTGSQNASYLANTSKTKEFPIHLLEFDDTELNLTLKDSLPFKDFHLDGVKAIFPLGDQFITIIKNNGFWIYTADSTTKRFSLVENITDPIRSIGIDDLERVWFIRNKEGANLEMISPFLSVDVSVSFEDTDITYVDQNIESAILVEARDMTGQLKETEIKLMLEGNAIFRDSQDKSYNVSTSSTSPTRVPIIITGSGAISTYTSYEGVK
ncbi:hypothetical protein INTERNEXUS_73 [Bacillus phage vB_BspM_Internexus]|nr:hypothetical protein INTERNEXUS_73 [Bacillus phage vB_BspM_Internexus]